MLHRVFHEGEQQQRRDFPREKGFFDGILHLVFRPVADILDVQIFPDHGKFFPQSDHCKPVPEQEAHVIGKLQTELLDAGEIFFLSHPKDDTEAVDEKVRFDLQLKIFQFCSCQGQFFLIDVYFQFLKLHLQGVKGLHSFIQFSKAPFFYMPAHGGIIVYMLLELLEWGFDVPMEIGEGIQGKGEDDEERHAEEGDQKKQVFLVYIRVVIDQQADVRPVHFVNLAELPPAGTGGGAAVQFNTTIYKRAFSQNRFIAAVQHNIKTVGAQDSAL